MAGEAQAIEAVANLGNSVASIFSKKQDVKLQAETTKTKRTEGILALKQEQLAKERERAKQQGRTQIVMFIVLAFLFVAVIAGLIFYKVYYKNE
jgi:membrane protein insertase Oxa1/YidC/SpoIIIJ